MTGGASVTAHADLIRADNPGPLTLTGTNSWLVRCPADRSEATVVDPGPDDPKHAEAILAAAHRHRTAITLIVVTHDHGDHSAGAPRLARLTGAPVRAAHRSERAPGPPLLPGEDVHLLSGQPSGLHVRATPGHTPDSVCLVLPADRALLTGDTLLGSGPTVIAHPEGQLADYLASLTGLQVLCGVAPASEGTPEPVTVLLPGHGPPAPAADTLRAALHHRQVRLAAVQAALAEGCTSVPGILAVAYPGLAADLHPAAAASIRAQLVYLGVPVDEVPVDEVPAAEVPVADG